MQPSHQTDKTHQQRDSLQLTSAVRKVTNFIHFVTQR